VILPSSQLPGPLFIRLRQQARFVAAYKNCAAISCRLLSLLLTYALLLQLVPHVATSAPATLVKSSLARRAAEKSNSDFNWTSLQASTGAWSEAISTMSGGVDVLPATITDAVVSRHKPTLNSGRIEGTLRVLQGESFTINGATRLTSDLYLPGTPQIQLSGGAQYGGTVSDGGAANPTNYTVSLAGGVDLPGEIHTNVDAVQLPADFPNSVPSPAGSRNVTVNSQSDVAGIGNWQTVRDLNVTGSHLLLDVPPGNYRTFTVNGNSQLNFIAGAYNFSNTFNLDGSAKLRATGLVTINVAQNLTVNSGALVLGNYTSPGDVRLNVLGSFLNVNGSSQVSGLIRVFNGTVTLSGSSQIRGQAIANSLTLNGGKIVGAVWPFQSGNSLTVFGPRRFDRTTGAPNQYLEQFALPAEVSAPYTLHIQNGESDGSKRISSATVKLNGFDLLTPNDLNQNIAGVDRTVVLAANNQLEVRLESAPGSYLTINIAGIVPGGDTVAPAIAITSPADHSTTTDTQTNVSGTASDPGSGASGIAHVYVNNSGAAYNSGDGTWTISNVPLALGANQLVTRAVDQVGNEATASITVTRESPTNQAPAVSAGLDQTLTFPQTASLQGTATDDGLPESSSLTATWTRVSGPGSVTFVNNGALSTVASFSAAGTYVLRLSASDGSLSTADDLTITVQPANQRPTVNGGTDQTLALPRSATLNGTVTDDGLPERGTLTITWSQVSGPGTVTFEDANLAETTASFSVSGSYILRLTASDTELTSNSDVTITVQPENQPPTINAGPDRIISLPDAAQFNGAAADDAWPAGSILSVSWNLTSGPGSVSFDNPYSPSMTATFAVAGVYVLRLTASDGELSSIDEVTITVTSPNQAPSVNAGLDQTISLPNNAAELNGTISDDGLPLGSSVLTNWSKLSGPGSVIFANPNVTVTTASFSEGGTYVLRLTANDSQLQTSDDITFTVIPENHAPTANAGPDQTITLPNTANLNGAVSDDGLPAGSSLTSTWSKVSGPGTVEFGGPNVTVTSAAFSEPGTYLLRLTAVDSQLTSSDDVVVNVDPENHAPRVNAGVDQTITLPAQASLTGTVMDDGWPRNSSVTVAWSRVSGPGSATFANPNSAVTNVALSVAGSYVLRLTANDSQLNTTDDLTVIVIPENHAPTANAGPDQTITLPNSANLNGSASDDGLPAGSALTSTWTKVSGPGTVTFLNANATITGAQFSASGNYVLRLTASDGTLNASDDVQITVKAAPANQPPAANAGPDQTVSLPNKNIGFFLNNVAAFNQAAGSPPVVVDFDNINAGTDITGTTVSGIKFDINPPTQSAPLIVTRAADTFTPSGFSGVIDAGTNKLKATSGANVLSPGGPVLGPGSNPLIENDDLKITFAQPVSAVGFDLLFQELDLFSAVGVTFLDANGNVLYSNSLLPDGSSNGGGAPGGAVFVGFVSTRANIATIIVDEYDGNNEFPDANIGFDTFRVQRLIPSTAIVNLSGIVADDGLPPNTTVTTSWSKVSGPGSVTFDDPAKAVTKVSFSDAGTYSLRLTGNDSQLSASDDVTITVNQGTVNYPPTVYAGADQAITLPQNSVTLNGTATDDGQPAGSTIAVAWTEISGPAIVTFGNANGAVTTAQFTTAGSYVLRLSASDGALITSDDVNVSVTPPIVQNQPPTAHAGPDQTTILAAGAQLEGGASDDGLPAGSQLTTRWTKVSGPATVTFLNANATITGAQFSAIGTYVLRLTASDGALNSSDDVTITVIDVAPPTVAITAPTDGGSVTEPTLVTGSVSNGAWVLEYSLDGDDNANNRYWTTFATGSGQVTNSSLGTLDPTMMLNGLFDIRLSATDSYGQISRTTKAVVVERNLKVGNFTVSFSDLNIPVAGVPMEVTRTYDTRDKRIGDFGFGWTLGVKNIRVEKARVLGLKWFETKSNEAFPNYCLAATASHLVTVTFPGGKVFKFEASTSLKCQRFAPISGGTLTFTPLPGTNGTLEIVGSSDFQVEGSVPGPVNLIGIDGGVDILNSSLFKFTAEDGTAFVIDQRAGLQSIRDTNNNTVALSAGGIIHSAGGLQTNGITFNRDALGRIINVIDPAGKAQTYTYDAAGDLVSYTDNENNTSTYTYDATHRLLTIHDPRGIEPIRNDYDADGRLISHTDGFGKVITYTHDLPGRSETITDRLGHSTIFHYDDRGNVLSKTDARGGVTTFTYDANDNLLTETNALGKTTTYTYDANDHRISITDPLSQLTQFTYNGLGKVLTTTDPLLHVTTNNYNGSGNLLTTKDALNNTTTFVYSPFDGQRILTTDALNNSTHYGYTNGYLTKETDALGHETTFSYDPNGNRASQTVKRTNALGQLETITTSYEYDKLNRLKKTTFADSSFTQVEYNSIGQQGATIDQLGHRTEFTYDDMGRLTRTDYPDGTHDETTYDAEGRRLTSKDRAGHVTSYTYDELRRLTKTTYPDNTFTSTTYDAAGQVMTTTDARSNITHYEYDNAGRRTKVRNALNQETTFAYDASGNQLSTTDALSHTTTYEYDLNNRRIKTIYADSSFDAVGYDALGRSSSKTDQAGKTSQFTYDELGRLTKVKDALAQETVYAYDEIGEQVSQTDANNHTTRFEYDQLGRRVKRILPGGQFETYSYDSGGNLQTRTDFNGHVTTFNYDLMRRLLSKVPDASLNQPTISFTYNSSGQRATMSDASGTTIYSYDVRNRLSSKQTPFGTLRYTYDEAGSLLTTRSSNANGLRVDYGYDPLNRLASVKDNNFVALNGGVTNYSYDNVGNLHDYSYPNGVHSSYAYNSLNRLTTITVGTNSSSLASYSYTLGAAGNRTAVTEFSGRTINYTYDDLYRLTSETIANDSHGVNGSANYNYDPVGNRLSRISTMGPVPSQSSTYDANDRLNSDSYDNNGNTTAAGSNNYTYDFENRLVSLSTQNSGLSTFLYDGDGNRVAKTSGGITTNYLVDTNNPTGYAQVVDELRGGTVVKSFTYGHDLISQRIVGSSLSFYGYDGHGSVRLLTDATATITDTYDYDAFGNLISRAGTTPNDYLYSGEQFDANLGFYYLRARYMNPTSGRFSSMDSYEGGSYDPSSLHKYSYTRNSPANLNDPSGQFSLVDTLNTSVLVGTISGFTIGLYTGGIEGAVHGAVQGAVIGALVPLTGAGVGSALLGNAARGVFITGWGFGLGNAATSGFSLATATTQEERTSAGINLLISAGFMYFGPKILQRVNTKIISAEQANIDSAARGYSQPPWWTALNVTETTLFAAAKYVRVYVGNQLAGAFVMEASEIQGLTPLQIQQKFALPFLPDKIAIAEIPAGTTIRVGVAGPNNFAPDGGGGMQVEIQNPNHPTPPTPPTRFGP
jgi:RHS repeat-associated protein